jgi:ATP-dependent Zn protease
MYGAKVKLNKDVDLNVLARRTAGMSGADLFNIINIAAVREDFAENCFNYVHSTNFK